MQVKRAGFYIAKGSLMYGFFKINVRREREKGRKE